TFSALSNGLIAETNRAQAAEATLTTVQNNLLSSLIAETNRAEMAEAVLALSLSNEISRATSAESAILTNMAQLDGTNLFTGTNTFAEAVIALNTNNVINGTFSGNLNGNAATAGSAALATTALLANNFSGSLSGDVTGTQGATTVASVGGQSSASVASGASAANAATNVNIPDTIVLRDSLGNFAAGAITANSLSGIGSGLTDLNPTNLAAGTAAINISGTA